MKKKKRTCTTLLVGKKASLDGSTIIARNEDGGNQPTPQKFVVVDTHEQPTHYVSKANQIEIPLPDRPFSYTSTPDVDDTYGTFAGAGINSQNVAMTATETITTNSRVLGADPLVDSGIGEADMVTLVLPYIQSAREGVVRLGKLLETYGTYESNGIAFSDVDDVWYLETIGGHHWAAIRIPNEAYVIAPNRFNIDYFDFDSKDTLCSPDLAEFIKVNHLNPDFDSVNFRHIFGSQTIKDTQYNTPRAWYIQQLFNKEIIQDPREFDTPFICYPDKKISIEDVKWALSSHYENTVFDPYSTGESNKLFRSIGLNRNLEVHLLQIRNGVKKELAGIHWLAFGPNTFNAVVPFYANTLDTPECYKNTPSHYNPQYIYWLNQTIALLGDTNYPMYSTLQEEFEKEIVALCRQIQIKTDKHFMDQNDCQAYLEKANQEMASIYLEKSTKLLGDMVMLGSTKMTLSFNLSD